MRSSVQPPRASQIAAHLKVFFDAQAAEEAPTLGHHGDAQADDFRGGAAGDRCIPVDERLGRRGDEPGQCAQKGRFAGAVRADDGDGLAFVQLEVDAEKGLEVTVKGIEVADLQQVHSISIPM